MKAASPMDAASADTPQEARLAATTLEGPAYCCPVCLAEGDWYLLRRGDAVVSWSCDEDLPAVLRAMQRDFEHTEVTVKERKR